jgi:hypothetical protein
MLPDRGEPYPSWQATVNLESRPLIFGPRERWHKSAPVKVKRESMDQKQKGYQKEAGNMTEWIIEAITWTVVGCVFMFS